MDSRFGKFRKQTICIVLGLLLCVPAIYSQGIFSGGTGASSTGSSMRRPKPDWDYDGKRILGHIGDEVYLWDAMDGHVLQKFVGHGDRLVSVQFSPDGRYVLSCSGYPALGNDASPDGYVEPGGWPKDTSTRLWDAVSGKQIWKLEGQIAAKFSPDGTRLVTFSLRKPYRAEVDVVMWDVRTGKKLFTVDEYKNRSGESIPGNVASTITFSPDGRTFLSSLAGNSAGIVTFFDAANGKVLGQVHDAESYNFLGQSQLATLGERSLEIWSENAQLVRRTPLLGSVGYEAEWTTDGDHIVGARFNNHANLLRIWDSRTGRSINRTFDRPLYSGDVLMDPDQKHFLLFWGGKDSARVAAVYTPLQFSLANIETGEEIWHAQAEVYRPLGFSPDGKMFLVGGGPNFIVFDAISGKEIVSLDLLGKDAGDGFGNCFNTLLPGC